jgi:Phage integrase, N-terminal SAM-like domain
MIDEMALRNFARQTIESYVRCIARFSRHFKSSPEHLGSADVRAYLVHLVQECHVSLSYDKQTRSALRFCPSTPLMEEPTCPSVIPICLETLKVFSQQIVPYGFSSLTERRPDARNTDFH